MNNQKETVIYFIKSKTKNRIYVGSAINFSKRKYEHINRLKKNKHHSIKLQNHVNKYSLNDIFFEIAEHVEDKNNLIKIEQKYIDLLNPYFNICKIAGSSLGYKKPIEKYIAEAKIKEEREMCILKNKPITDIIDSVLP